MVLSSKTASGLKNCIESNSESTPKNIHIVAEILSPSTIARTEISGNEGSYILYIRGILHTENGTHIINQSLLVDAGTVSEMAGHQHSSDFLIVTPDANEVEIKLTAKASISLELIVRPLSNLDYRFDSILNQASSHLYLSRNCPFSSQLFHTC